MTRVLVLFVVLLIVGVAFGQEEKKPAEKKYEFPGGVVFTTSGEYMQKLETPSGRKLEAESRIHDIHFYGDDIYVVSQWFIRRYDVKADRDQKSDLSYAKVFVYVYQLPAFHEILGTFRMPGHSSPYYSVYLRSNKSLPLEQQNIVFRGFVCIYPNCDVVKETRVQYRPYTELPKEGRWMLVGGRGKADRIQLTIKNETTGEERLIGFVRKEAGKELEFSDQAGDIIPPAPAPGDPSKLF